MVTTIRLFAQQLAEPRFDSPEEAVGWMGAVQAQDVSMSKWAVGMRTKNPSLRAVEKAVADGKILRLHILRPTWHYVLPEHVRWMLQLTGLRIKRAWMGYGKTAGLGMSEEACSKANKLLEKILRGKALSAEEISAAFARAGIEYDTHRVRYVLGCAEADGLLCGGPQKGNKNTYALLAERAPQAKGLPKEEALGTLARLYFQSHSPASLADFTWWSGLSQSEAKAAVTLIKAEMTEETFGGRTLWVHDACARLTDAAASVQLLPAFDEYLISYKDRTDCLDAKHHPKAFNRFGTFYPVILSGGRAVGNWKKVPGAKAVRVETDFFVRKHGTDKKRLREAEERYLRFLAG